MMIGLSLPLDYLAGTAAAGCWAHVLGPPETALAALRDRGAGAVEIQGVAPGAAAADLQTAAQRVRDTGLAFSLHGALDDRAGEPEAGHPLSAILDGPATRAATVLVVHARAGASLTSAERAAATVRDLERLIADLGRRGLPVRPALELCRYHGRDAPDTTYDALLEIGRALPGLGFCWDLGHAASSCRQGRLPAAPPVEFLARVIHVHAHDLGTDGNTHWPPAAGGARLAPPLRLLAAAGYRGIINLELYPVRWPAELDARAAILGSIDVLRRLLPPSWPRPAGAPRVC